MELHHGYLGFEEGGQLTEKVRRNPYSIILFDEIEKANADVLNILLQILEDGNLTDSQGRKVNFKNTIIILTSNIGANLISNQKTIGFSDIIKQDKNYNKKNSISESIKKDVINEVKKEFKPEFLNRIDEIIIFNKLTNIDLIQISNIVLKQLVEKFKKINIDIKVDNNISEFLINNKEYNFEYGARPIRRIIQNKIENLITNEILEGKIKYNEKIEIKEENNKLVINTIVENYNNIDKYNYLLER